MAGTRHCHPPSSSCFCGHQHIELQANGMSPGLPDTTTIAYLWLGQYCLLPPQDAPYCSSSRLSWTIGREEPGPTRAGHHDDNPERRGQTASSLSSASSSSSSLDLLGLAAWAGLVWGTLGRGGLACGWACAAWACACCACGWAGRAVGTGAGSSNWSSSCSDSRFCSSHTETLRSGILWPRTR